MLAWPVLVLCWPQAVLLGIGVPLVETVTELFYIYEHERDSGLVTASEMLAACTVWMACFAVPGSLFLSSLL